MTDSSQPEVGVVHNGHVWDGTRWNPAPSQAHQPWPPPSGSAPVGYRQLPITFADPQYAYGLTRRAAQDIHFLARFGVVLAWIWIVSAGVSVIFGILSLVGALAALQSVTTHLPR